MSYLRLLPLAALTALAASCGTGTDTALPALDVASTVDAPYAPAPASVFDVEMVMDPAVTDSTLIGRNPQLCAILDGNFYIASSRMMIFAPSGRCISSFDRQGNGPGEYGRYATFSADPATRGWIALSSTNDYRAFSYTSTGEFTRCDTLAGLSFINSIGDRWITINASHTDPAITVFYLNAQLDPTDSLVTPLRRKIFAIPGGSVIYNPTINTSGTEAMMYWNDSIYSVGNPAEGCRPVASVELGRYRMPDDFNPSENFERAKEYISPDILFTHKHFLVWFRHSGRSRANFYDRATGALVASLSSPEGSDATGVPFPLADGSTVSLVPSAYTSGDTFYFIAPEESMCELKGAEDSNPAIFAVKLR